MKVGVIGLGKMGFPMSKNLLRANHEVTVYDSNPERVKQLIKLGARPSSPYTLRCEFDFALIMVFPPSNSYEAIFDGGLPGAMSVRMRETGVKPIIIDGGNADYLDSTQIGEKLKKNFEIDYLDVGFSGGPDGAERADLAAFVGGDYEAYQKTLPILEALCKDIHYLGPQGSGHYGKVVDHNTREYNIMASIAELSALAYKLGFDPKKISEASNSGLSQNKLQELYLGIPENEIGITGCRIDGGNAALLALREAKRVNTPMPVTTLVHYLRDISRELYDTGKISQETKDALLRDMMKQIELLEFEYAGYRTVRSMAIQAKLREKFGGHKVYEIKK